MIKEFRKWCNVKEKVDELDTNNNYFKEREIWWCYLGENIGFEQNGKGDLFLRPVLIFKKFNRKLCWVIPLSTKLSKGNFFFPVLSESNKIRIATIPQLKMIDVKRLSNKIDSISKTELKFIREKVIEFIR
jgi:mRNA interferase MazF